MTQGVFKTPCPPLPPTAVLPDCASFPGNLAQSGNADWETVELWRLNTARRVWFGLPWSVVLGVWSKIRNSVLWQLGDLVIKLVV